MYHFVLGERLFDAKRADLYEQSCDDIDVFVDETFHNLETTPEVNDLTTVNILIQKQQIIEKQMKIKSEQVQELESQAKHLERMSPEKTEDIEKKKEEIQQKFTTILAPLETRRKELEVNNVQIPGKVSNFSQNSS